MPRVLDHVHSLVKYRKFFGEWHWKCDDPDCSFTCLAAFALGKRMVCAICHEKDIIVDKKQLKLSKLRCENCSNTKEAIEKRKLAETLATILGKVPDV